MIAGVPDTGIPVSEVGPIVGAPAAVTTSTCATLPAVSVVGYARVSTDQLSGVRDDRPGDTVVVVALDRLGRSLSGVIRHRRDADRAGSAAAVAAGGDRLLHPDRADAGRDLHRAGRLRTGADARAGGRGPPGRPAAWPTHRPTAPADCRAGAPAPRAARRRGVDRGAGAQLRPGPPSTAPCSRTRWQRKPSPREDEHSARIQRWTSRGGSTLRLCRLSSSQMSPR